MTQQEIENETLAGVPIVVRSYAIGDNFYCHVENEDPGAVIARSGGSSRKEAISMALEKANTRLVHQNS